MKTTNLIITALLFMAISILPQNISGKLGSGGTFDVKNSSNTSLFSINENDGAANLSIIKLPATLNSNSGIIYKNGITFLHAFGNNNIFLGYNSGNFTATNSANGNIAIGTATLNGLTTGVENTAVGNSSLHSNTTGTYNSALGSFSLEPNTTGNHNSAFGYASLRSNTTGENNSAFGSASLYSNTTGHDNAAFGISALKFNTTGFFNSAFGMNTLTHNTNGGENSAFGQGSLFANTTGNSNSGFGTLSLSQNTTGFSNTALGYSAGSTVTTGSNLTLIGNNAQPSSSSANNEITLGNNQITTLRANVTTITSLSDARDKKNIKDLSLGLDLLMNIHPREFNWDKREWYSDGKSDGSKMQDVPTAGFIAQELDKAQTDANAEWLKLVLKENPDRIEASSGNLFPIVVKAVQDLKMEKDFEIAQLKNENEKLRNELASLKELQTRLTKLEQTMRDSEVKFSSNITE
ncbi:MAG TPA: tail fiber domain-containing protein [Ignavibacteriaceae bacterium]|nr:tail fiber domain-containing protein [Ignavibacteriaceae bacterium]HRQ55481.1 tail fiber domain-containing protein [Ignavibacteriaceae bacterium]